MEIFRLWGVISVNRGDVRAQLAGVERDARAAGQRILRQLDEMGQEAGERLGERLREGAKAALAALSALTAGAVTLGVRMNASLEQASIGFETMLGSAERARQFLDELADFAARTPFAFPDLVQASQRLLAFGFAAEEVIPTLRAVGDAAAAMGGSAEVIDSVTRAIGQMAAKGKVQAEEMLQLTEAGIPAWEILAEKIGVSVPEAMDRVSQGAVDARTAIDALVSGIEERFGGMMERQSRTLAGLWSTIKDTFEMALAQAVRPFFEELAGGAQRLADYLQSAEFEAWARGTARTIRDDVLPALRDLVAIAATVAKGLMEMGQWMTQHSQIVIPALAAVLTTKLAPAIAAVIAALRSLTSLTNPLTLALAGIGAILGVVAVAYARHRAELQEAAQAQQHFRERVADQIRALEQQEQAVRDELQVLDQFLPVVQELGQKQARTEEETRQLEEALRKLGEQYPWLRQEIGATTGSFDEQIRALQAHRAQLDQTLRGLLEAKALAARLALPDLRQQLARAQAQLEQFRQEGQKIFHYQQVLASGNLFEMGRILQREGVKFRPESTLDTFRRFVTERGRQVSEGISKTTQEVQSLQAQIKELDAAIKDYERLASAGFNRAAAEAQKAVEKAATAQAQQQKKTVATQQATNEELAKLARELALAEIEATQGKVARQLEEERLLYEERKKLAAGHAQLLQQIEADYQRRVAQIREQAAREQAEQTERAADEATQAWVAAIERRAELEDWSAGQVADALHRVLNEARMSADLRAQLEHRVAMLRKQYAKEAAEEAQRRQEEEQRAADEAVREQIQAIERQAELEDWSAQQQAQAIEKVLATSRMSYRLRLELEYQAALLRKKHAAEAIRDEQQRAEEARRAADQATQAWAQEIRRTAELQDWSASQTADALQEVLDKAQMSADVRKDLEYEVARLRKQAEEDAAEAAKRRAEEEQRAADETVRRQVEAIERRARLEDWSARQQADAIQQVIDSAKMSAELQEDLSYKVALLRKQHAEEAARAEQREADEAKRAADEAARAWVQSIERRAELEDWSADQTAAALDRVLQEATMSADLRADLEYKVQRLRKQAAEQATREEEQQLRERARQLVADVEYRARLEDWSAAQVADALQQILDREQLVAEDRIELTRRVALLRKEAADEAAEAEKRRQEEALQAADRAVQARVRSIERQAELEDWAADRTADALERVLREVEMSADLRADLEHRIAMLRKEAAEEASKAEEQAMRERTRALLDEVRYRAQLEDWSAGQQAQALQRILDEEKLTAEDRLAISREVALLRKRAADDAAEAERQQAEEAANAAQESAQAWIDAIERQAELEDWSAERTAAALSEVLDTATLTADARVALQHRVAMLYKQAEAEQARASQEAAEQRLRYEQEIADDLARLRADETARFERELAKRVAEFRQAGVAEAQIQEWVTAQRRQHAQEQADALARWAETYIGHEIEMGRATKQQLLDALREVKRINEERGANTEDLARRIALLEKEIADETITQQQRAADRLRELYIERLELEGRSEEAQIARAELRRDQALRDQQLTEAERAQIVANTELEIQRIRQEALERQSQDLVSWFETYISHEVQMGRATVQQQLAGYRELKRILDQRGVDTAELARKIEALEKEVADQAVAQQREAADRIADLYVERLELQGKALEAALERERLARERALRQEGLTEEERRAIIATSEAKIAKIRSDHLRQQAEELVAWTKTYVGHEVEMGRATEAQMLAALRAAKRILDERGADTADLAREIELLEKELADETVAQQRRAADNLRQLLIERLELEGRTTEAAIARIEAERDRALEDERLTEAERIAIRQNAELEIAKIREDERRKQSEELISWTEQYIGHEIKMGRATKENMLAALREVQRILAERGISHEELARKIESLEKDIADETVAKQKELAAARMEFLRSVGQVSFQEELTYQRQLVEATKAGTAERFQALAAYYDTLSGYIQRADREERDAIRRTLEAERAKWAEAGEAGRAYVMVIDALIAKLKEAGSEQMTFTERLRSSFEDLGEAVADALENRIGTFLDTVSNQILGLQTHLLNLQALFLDFVKWFIAEIIKRIVVASGILQAAAGAASAIATAIASWNPFAIIAAVAAGIALIAWINSRLRELGEAGATVGVPPGLQNGGGGGGDGGDGRGRSAGRQVSEITGPTRDLLVSLLSPLANLDSQTGILQRQYDVQVQILSVVAGIRDRIGELVAGGVQMPAVGVASGVSITVNGPWYITPASGSPADISSALVDRLEEELSARLATRLRGRGE